MAKGENAKRRIKIPQNIVDEIMVLCKRKCFWCETQEPTKIHHIDENSSNNEQDNLCPCCSICHEKFHSTTPFARKITQEEIKMRRNNFYSKQSLFKIEISGELNEIKPSIIKIELIKENV
ncbi:MAG: hypothetical protein KKC19_00805 [Nanoarchaeota archaeon]|nr:hypothetical protein [Nanoarchaeota archaeon]